MVACAALAHVFDQSAYTYNTVLRFLPRQFNLIHTSTHVILKTYMMAGWVNDGQDHQRLNTCQLFK